MFWPTRFTGHRSDRSVLHASPSCFFPAHPAYPGATRTTRPKRRFIMSLPLKAHTACCASPPQKGPQPAPQTPPGSAAETSGRQPQLGSFSLAVFSTFDESLPLPGYSASLASPHHSLPKTHLLPVAPLIFISLLFHYLVFFSLTREGFTVYILPVQKYAFIFSCGFCTSLYCQLVAVGARLGSPRAKPVLSKGQCWAGRAPQLGEAVVVKESF